MKNIEFTREFLHLKCIDTIEVHVYETEKGVFPVDIISNVGGSITDAELKIPLWGLVLNILIWSRSYGQAP